MCLLKKNFFGWSDNACNHGVGLGKNVFLQVRMNQIVKRKKNLRHANYCHSLDQKGLSNRKQYVSLKGFDSEVRNITCGVPQGSSLGPLLFLLYINDFRLCLSETSSGHFADDTFILYNSMKPKAIETIVNIELKQVVKWLRLNKLSLNAGKKQN